MVNNIKKILIAEDEKAISKALVLKLNHAGFIALPAYDGEETLAMLAKDKYDLVLLDLMMPKVDGFSVLTQMQAQGIKVPVIITSNLGQEEDIKRAKSLGAIDYYVKSDTALSEIIDKIKNISL